MIACLEVAVAAGQRDSDTVPYRIARAIYDIQKLGRRLHRRYEANCSYAWADTDRYRSQTERLEAAVVEIAAACNFEIEFQRDPRGWPIILRIARQEYRLGGPS